MTHGPEGISEKTYNNCLFWGNTFCERKFRGKNIYSRFHTFTVLEQSTNIQITVGKVDYSNILILISNVSCCFTSLESFYHSNLFLICLENLVISNADYDKLTVNYTTNILNLIWIFMLSTYVRNTIGKFWNKVDLIKPILILFKKDQHKEDEMS